MAADARQARKGDVVIAVSCRCGKQLIHTAYRPTWRCTSCGGRGTDKYRLTLGAGGALPAYDPLSPDPDDGGTA